MNPAKMRFYSGGQVGAEAAFGQNAERFGIREITFSHDGQDTERKRGLTVLSPEALKKGAISLEIVSARMGRSFAREKEIQPALLVLFHVINMGFQVFSVGSILPNDTVTGGTGWGVELAKWFHRPLSVYDQELCAWFSWIDNRWEPDTPLIRFETFAGIGTRHLTDEGSRAIGQLFARSFGTQPRGLAGISGERTPGARRSPPSGR